jgi:hypothetical protein
MIGFYNRDEKCLQRGTDWVLKYSGLRFVFKGLRTDVKIIPVRIDALCDLLIHDRFIEIYHYSMEQSPSLEANQFSASQEIPRILWNPKVYYCIHECIDMCHFP